MKKAVPQWTLGRHDFAKSHAKSSTLAFGDRRSQLASGRHFEGGLVCSLGYGHGRMVAAFGLHPCRSLCSCLSKTEVFGSHGPSDVILNVEIK